MSGSSLLCNPMSGFRFKEECESHMVFVRERPDLMLALFRKDVPGKLIQIASWLCARAQICRITHQCLAIQRIYHTARNPSLLLQILSRRESMCNGD